MTGCHLLSHVLQLTLGTSPIAQGSAGTMWACHSQGDFYVPSLWVRFDCPPYCWCIQNPLYVMAGPMAGEIPALCSTKLPCSLKWLSFPEGGRQVRTGRVALRPFLLQVSWESGCGSLDLHPSQEVLRGASSGGEGQPRVLCQVWLSGEHHHIHH